MYKIVEQYVICWDTLMVLINVQCYSWIEYLIMNIFNSETNYIYLL